VWENLHRFVLYTVATSSLGWDTGRALTNAAAILVLGPSVLYVLRRAARRAAFGAAVVVEPPPSPDAAPGAAGGLDTGSAAQLHTGRSSSCTSTVSP
jgi:energy-coupling factor transport system substrate-specific component